MVRCVPWIWVFVCLASGLRPEGPEDDANAQQLNHDSAEAANQNPASPAPATEGQAGANSMEEAWKYNNEIADQALPGDVYSEYHKKDSKPDEDTEVLQTKIDQRTDVCDRMQQVTDGKLNFKEALSGVEITAVTRADCKQNCQIFKKVGANSTEDQWYGFDYELIKEIQRRGNIKFKIIYDDDNKSPGNEWLEKTVKYYDINLDTRGLSPRRENAGITMIYGFWDASVILVTDRDTSFSDSISLKTLLYPYTADTWVVFLVSVLATAIVYWYIEAPKRASEEVDEDKGHILYTLYHILMQLGTVGAVSPSGHPGRVVSMSWSLFCLVFVAGYTANLATCLMTARQSAAPWHNIDDVMDAKGRVCFRPSTMSAEWMDKNLPMYNKVVKNEITGPIENMVTKKACEVSLQSNEGYFLALQNKTLNPNCMLRRIGKKLMKGWAGWHMLDDLGPRIDDKKSEKKGLNKAIRCTALIKDVVRYYFIEMYKDGTLEKIKTKYLFDAQKTSTCSADEMPGFGGQFHDKEETTDSGLPIGAMAGVFIIHAVAIVVAVLVMKAFSSLS